MKRDWASLEAMICEALRLPEGSFGPELRLGAVPQWDSMGHMEVIARLEDDFGVEVTPDLIAQLASVADIARFLEIPAHVE